jgi:hypothetical protein
MQSTNKTPIVIDKITFGYLDWKNIFGMADDIDEFVIMGTVNPICPTANAIILRATYPNKKITMDFAGCGFMDEQDKELVKRLMAMQQIEVING